MEKREIRRTLARLELARKQLLQPYFSGLGLTLGQGQPRILSRLLAGDGLTQRELAWECSLDVTTLSRTLDRMEEAGFLVREAHPDSRRAYRIRLTEAGRDKAREVAAGFAAVDEVIWAGFTGEEMEALERQLRRICENLERSEGVVL